MLLLNSSFILLLVKSLRYFLGWLTITTGLFLVGEIILPEWITAQINFLVIFIIILLALIIVSYLETQLVSNKPLDKKEEKHSFWIKLVGNFLLAGAIISALMFQINWYYVIIITSLSLIISWGLFYKR